jgi:ATP-dependent RNA helicase DeaD
MQKRPFSELGIAPELLKAIESLGFELPAPIQSEAIPPALEGRDVVGQSQTGSGKTMAFAVPALQLIDPKLRAVQVLILCPTRELAMQVCAEVHKLTPFKPGITAVPVYGGSSYVRQIRALKQGAQMVVGTPGRVLDLIGRKDLKLEALKMLIFDEADKMLDMGFRDDIDTLMISAPKERQTICFSATFSKQIRNLINTYTENPATITIEHKALTVPTVEQRYYEVRGRSKLETLCRVLDVEDAQKAIVFTNTKRAADEITDALVARGYTADRLHGDLTQMMRDRVMKNFRSGNIDVLVATDVASRGLDVDDVDIIFNFDLPYDEEDYVHRIGRTGRAGRKGKAVSLVGGKEIFLLQRIQRYIKVKITREKVPSQEEVVNMRVDQQFEKVKSLLESGDFKSHDATVERLLEAGFTSTDISSALLHILLLDSGREGEEIHEDRAPFSERAGRDDRGGRDNNSNRGGSQRPRQEDRRSAPSSAPAGEQGQMIRMFINVGSVDNINPGQIAGALYNSAKLPSGCIGTIEIFDRSSYFELPEGLADQAIRGVAEARLRNRKLRVDYADGFGSQPPKPKFRKPGHKAKAKDPTKAPFFKQFQAGKPTRKQS